MTTHEVRCATCGGEIAFDDMQPYCAGCGKSGNACICETCSLCIDARNAPGPQAADFCLKHRNCSTCGDRMQLDYICPTQPWCAGCELPADHCTCEPVVLHRLQDRIESLPPHAHYVGPDTPDSWFINRNDVLAAIAEERER